MLQSNHIKEDNYENDDLVSFQLELSTVHLYFSQLVKYSKRARDEFLFSDIIKRIPTEIEKVRTKFQLSTENIILFFQLLRQNYNIKDDILTYKDCINLLKLSKHFEVRKLTDNIKKYVEDHNKNDVDFIIQMIQYANDGTEIDQGINKEIEAILVDKIDDCLSNEKFVKLPISIIYRVVEKSFNKSKKSDKLYDFIKQSMSKLCILFQFIELENLTDDRLDDICDIYLNSNEETKQYFNFLKCNLKLINEMRTKKKSLNSEMEVKTTELENMKQKLCKIQSEIEILKQIQMNELELKVKELEQKLNASETARIQTEKEKEQLKKDLDEERNCKIKGKIEAKVKNGLLVYGEIDLVEKNFIFDISKSKYIISTIQLPMIGLNAYEKGEPLTSLKQRTIDFGCKSGTYYIRCLVFDVNGKSFEFVSNGVTTNSKSISFEYEGESREILLSEGKYKLEVWGAQGGDSTGSHYNSSSPGKGGLGGYSSGILNLTEQERLHICVGESGHSSNSGDGSTTDGSFPDGGGTKTGYRDNFTAIPGTGGGSTSIRISTNSIYSRVIVAGGGGGASGSTHSTDNGGFGGGMNGGNCYHEGKLQSQGCGTQTGSSCGLGSGSNGDPGEFGKGATGKYNKGGTSGGGGGGGWYGGGGGGCGWTTYSSSGGGGSGWVFTESNLNSWKSGDCTNANKFTLTSKYYLTNASTISGNEQFPNPSGNGNENGHQGNGYAKITPLFD